MFTWFPFLQFLKTNPKANPSSSSIATEVESIKDADISVLLFGTPGSGKSAILRRIKMLHEFRSDEFALELINDRKFIQYDLITGVLKVMTKMLSSEGTEYHISATELKLYKKLKGYVRQLYISGDFDPLYKSAKTKVINLGIAKNSVRKEPEQFKIDISREELGILEAVTKKEGFKKLLRERHIRMKNSAEPARPLKVSDGLSEMLKIPDIWYEFDGTNPSKRTQLLIRKPNGGLPLKTMVNIEHEQTIAFAEFPGRLESFSDTLSNLQRLPSQIAGFNYIILVLAFTDFDVEVETAEKSLLLHDHMLEVLSNASEAVKQIPMLLIFTKFNLMKEKLEVLKEFGLLQKQFDRIGFDWTVKENTNINKLLPHFTTHISDSTKKRYETVWGEGRVLTFPRPLKLDFDNVDEQEIMDTIIDKHETVKTRKLNKRVK